MITWFKLLNVVQDGECHGKWWNRSRCSKEIKKQQPYKPKQYKAKQTISESNGLGGWQGSKLWLVWPCSRCLSPMELWLAAIIGFSIGYLLAPLFYDKW
jgi:hypothetical protein